MYIETSSPRGKGDNAKLVLSVPGYGELACLTFYYHMYGEAMGSLIVLSGNTAVFSASGDQGNYWRRATRTIRLKYTVSFFGFEAMKIYYFYLPCHIILCRNPDGGGFGVTNACQRCHPRL